MSIVSDLVGGIMGAGAADQAAAVESQAATKAGALEENKAQNALDFQNRVYDSTTAGMQPYQAVGSTSANALASRIATPFQAPTLTEAQNSPGFQFRLNTGVDSLDKSAAARGDLFSGSQGVALENYGQGLAESNYEQDFNRAMSTYMTNYSTALQGAQLGLSATSDLGHIGQAAAGNVAGVNLRTGEDQAQQINNAAAARASGYLGTASAWSNMAGNLAGDVAGGIGNMDFSGGSSPLEMAGQFAGM